MQPRPGAVNINCVGRHIRITPCNQISLLPDSPGWGGLVGSSDSDYSGPSIKLVNTCPIDGWLLLAAYWDWSQTHLNPDIKHIVEQCQAYNWTAAKISLHLLNDIPVVDRVPIQISAATLCFQLYKIKKYRSDIGQTSVLVSCS